MSPGTRNCKPFVGRGQAKAIVLTQKHPTLLHESTLSHGPRSLQHSQPVMKQPQIVPKTCANISRPGLHNPRLRNTSSSLRLLNLLNSNHNRRRTIRNPQRSWNPRSLTLRPGFRAWSYNLGALLRTLWPKVTSTNCLFWLQYFQPGCGGCERCTDDIHL